VHDPYDARRPFQLNDISEFAMYADDPLNGAVRRTLLSTELSFEDDAVGALWLYQPTADALRMALRSGSPDAFATEIKTKSNRGNYCLGLPRVSQLRKNYAPSGWQRENCSLSENRLGIRD
jgi:hypothetical protein